MSTHDDLQAGIAEGFDILAAEFAPSQTVSLAIQSPTDDAFETLLTLTGKWKFEYSAYREYFQLEIADESSGVNAAVAEATHVLIDGDVYTIRGGDTLEPKGLDVTWKLSCDLFERKGHYSAL